MANTMFLISKIVVGAGGVSTLSFTSIPQTYSDLYIKASLRTNANGEADNCILSVNGSTANIGWARLYGEGTGIGANTSVTSTNISMVTAANTLTANVFGNGDLYLPDYTTSKNKTLVGTSCTEKNGTVSYQYSTGMHINNSAAITSLSFAPVTGPNFVEHSTIYLYGINNS